MIKIIWTISSVQRLLCLFALSFVIHQLQGRGLHIRVTEVDFDLEAASFSFPIFWNSPHGNLCAAAPPPCHSWLIGKS